MRRLLATDLFCGAGGVSAGILQAAAQKSRLIDLLAVNHWRTAINTHTLNHPAVRHLCETVENTHPLDLIPGGRLDLLAASCECRFHSIARGGGPCNEQSRSQPWQIIRWASDIRIDNIMMENVREFLNWGPLHSRTKRPIKSRQGKFFRTFVNALENLGYTVEWRVQTAADFGDPTSRKRLILLARRGKPVTWPAPTHGPGRAAPWRTARECIDWSLKGHSIFDRKRPLCDNTMARIAAGLRKFGGQAAEPFLIILNSTDPARLASTALSLDEPLPTIVANGRHIGLVEPFLTHLTHHGANAARCHSLNQPMPTVTGAHRGEMALVETFMIQTDQTGSSGPCIHKLENPLPTIVSKQNLLLVEPLILKYYKTGRCKPVSQPLDTVTTRQRFMLVECEGGTAQVEIDIRTRMLQPGELSLAHSFPRTYQFTGTKEDQTKQIGNSVPVQLAAAHALAALSD